MLDVAEAFTAMDTSHANFVSQHHSSGLSCYSLFILPAKSSSGALQGTIKRSLLHWQRQSTVAIKLSTCIFSPNQHLQLLLRKPVRRPYPIKSLCMQVYQTLLLRVRGSGSETTTAHAEWQF